MSRTDFAQLVNKMQQGIPTRFWAQMMVLPRITLWEVPQAGQVAPDFVVSWFGLQQMEDANLGGGEIPDIHYRATEALCARMALRLAEKFGPDNPQAHQIMMQEKKALADEAWADLQRRDQELGPITVRPNLAGYGRL